MLRTYSTQMERGGGELLTTPHPLASDMRVPWRNTRPWALLTLGIAAIVILACGSERQISLEQEAQALDTSLICPVCPGETIDQAQAELARQMRVVVRGKLADGWSREQILQFFVDRYGEGVLAAPPKQGFNFVAWIVPFATVTAGAVLLFFVIRAMKRGSGTGQEEQPPLKEGLEPYLSLVDRELGIPQAGSQDLQKPGLKNG